MTEVLLIGFAGAFGAISRYGLQYAVAHVLGRPTILGTMAVNLSGCFVIGLVMALALDRHLISNSTRLVLVVGFLGAYTTFSSLMFDSVHSIETSDLPLAAANLGFSAVLGLCLTYAGLVAGRSL
ncbi:MAG TPA: CrcB family protein [Dehalococcoidia bacterium]|nr:CrcB family protein [Dehalococcoidia bacterium]